MTSLSLMFGDLELVDNESGAYKIETLAEGTGWGNPEPIEVAIRSLLQDGSIVATQGYDNREVGVRVIITAPDSAALAEGEAALFAEIGRRNTLTYTPADGWGPPTAFDVVTSSLDHVGDDLAEVRGQRTYVVRLVCSPFGRSVDEVVIPALGSGTATDPTTVAAVNDGSSTTGWAGAWSRTKVGGSSSGTTSGSATPATSGGQVSAASPTYMSNNGATSATEEISLTLTGSVDVSVTKQLVVQWAWNATGIDANVWVCDNVRVEVNGSTFLTRTAGTGSPARGVLTEGVFEVPSGITTVTSIRIVTSLRCPALTSANGPFSRSLHVDDISRNNANTPTVGTSRQLPRVIEVAGSARSPGSVAIEHEVSSLGDVIAYFWPNQEDWDYSPPLRQFRVSGGGVTSDATLVSGARENIVGSTATFEVPVARTPAGTYTVCARLSGSTAHAVTWTATTVLNGVALGPAQTGTRNVGLTATYSIQTLGRVQLPTRDLGRGSGAFVRITLTATTGTVNLDEAWIFNGEGQLNILSCGTGTPSAGGSANRVFLELATVETPRPTIRIGNNPDGSDAYFPSALQSWVTPEFTPPQVNVFTVTTNALDAAVTLRHHPRWHTHAAS